MSALRFPVQPKAVSILALAGVSLGAICAVAQAQGAGETVVLDAVVIEGADAPIDDASGVAPVADEASGYVQPVSVTATKGGGSRLTVPQPVSVIGREQIEVQQATTISEAVRYSPGVRGNQFGTNNRLDFFTIRGFDASQDGLFWDGLPLFYTAFGSWRIDPVVLERIEVLRGPASVLYGGTSPGGIINLISKSPTEEPYGEIEVGVNSYGQAYSSADLSGPLDEEGIYSYRVTTLAYGGDNYDEIGESFRGLVAPVFTYEPNPDTNLTIRGYYQNDDANNVPGFLPYEGTVVPAPFGFIDRDLFTSDPSVDAFEREQAFIGYEFEHRFNDTSTIRQNARYGHLESTYSLLYGFGYASDLSSLNGLEGGTDRELARLNFRTDPVSDLVTIDTQGEIRFETGAVDHVLLAGLDYRYYSLDQTQGTSTLYSPLDVIDPVYGINIGPIDNVYIDNTQTLRQTGLYLQDRMSYEDLVVTLNARYDFVETELDNNIGEDASGSDGIFSGRIGAAYLFDNGFAPYASYSRFYTPVLGLDADGNPFEQGDGEQYEVGFKYQPPGFNSFFTASLFHLTRGNVLTNDVSGGNPFTPVQTGEIRSKGIELEATVSLMQGLNLIGAFTAYDLEVTESNDIDLGFVPEATPEEFASLWLDYEVQGGRLEGLRLGGGVRYVGESYADPQNTLTVPDYFAVDAAVSYEYENWRGAINVSNLFDEGDVVSCQGPNACFYVDPRKITGSLAYRF